MSYFWIFGMLKYWSYCPRKTIFLKSQWKKCCEPESQKIGLFLLSRFTALFLLTLQENCFSWTVKPTCELAENPKIRQCYYWKCWVMPVLVEAVKMTVLLVLWQLGLEIWIFGEFSFFLKPSLHFGYPNHVPRFFGWAAITVQN